MRDYLLEVLFDALLAADRTSADLHAYAKAHKVSGITSTSLSRWGTGKEVPADLDKLVYAVAGLLETSPLTYWRRALSQWSKDQGLTLLARQAIRREAQAQLARKAHGRRARPQP